MKDKELKELKEIEYQLEMINKQISDAIENYPKLIELAEKLRQTEQRYEHTGI